MRALLHLVCLLLIALWAPAALAQRCAQHNPFQPPSAAPPPQAHSDVRSVPLAKRAAALAVALGKPAHLLVGIGSADVDNALQQGIAADVYDRYLNGVGADSWIHWNLPQGSYVDVVAQLAHCLGAVPMFTLYQMAARGDSNLSGLDDFGFMRDYWAQVRMLFNRIRLLGKPVLVNLEPDFWGYAQRAQRDPTRMTVQVALASNGLCPHHSNDMVGFTACLLDIARQLAPNAYVGLPPSLFYDLRFSEIGYLQRIGAQRADFLVMQTLDRDVGCFEAAYAPANCTRASDSKGLWVEADFKAHFARARQHHEAFGLPLIWWQTPLGVPSTTPGGKPGGFRDNRVAYFLSHTHELSAAGGVGAVFSAGEKSQTTLQTDGGQFKRLSAQYRRAPTPLP